MKGWERLPQTVWLLGWASLFNDTSSELIAAVLPLYLAKIGTVGLGIGLIGGVEESARSLLSLASGYRADRAKQRKPFLLAGYGLSALAKTTIALTTAWPQILGLRALDRAGKAIRTPPRDALIAAAVPERIRGLALGAFHMAMGLSALMGNALAGWLWQALSPSAAFGGSAGLALLGALALHLSSRQSP